MTALSSSSSTDNGRFNTTGSFSLPRYTYPPPLPRDVLLVTPDVTYFLLLRDSFMHVGHTTHTLITRFNEHLSRKGAKWTRQHPPVSVIALFPGDVENNLTIRAIHAFGLDRVRGGGWCCIDPAYSTEPTASTSSI